MTEPRSDHWGASLLRRLELAAMIASGVVLAIMAVHVIADVSARFVWGRPLDGTTEIVSRYYMVAAIYLPLSYLHAQDGHISAGLISDLLPMRWRRLTDAASSLLMAAFGFVLAWRCGVEATRATASSETLQTAYYFLPTWPARWIIPAAISLLVIRALVSAGYSLVLFVRPAERDDLLQRS